VRIRSSASSHDYLKNNWLRPKNNAALCDYFISMFDDLGTNQQTNTQTMGGYNGFNVLYEPITPIVTSSTDGIKINDGERHRISSVRVTVILSFLVIDMI